MISYHFKMFSRYSFQSLRSYSSKLYHVEKHTSHFSINGSTKVSFAWLRDHCRSDSHYDQRNFQRKLEYPKPAQTLVEDFKIVEDNLIIHWKDQHSSSFSLARILDSIDQSIEEDSNNQILWKNVNCPIQDVQVDFNDYMNSESGLWSALKNIWTHGFCIVKNTPLSIEKGTKPLAQRIGPRFQGPEAEFWILEGKPDSPDSVSDTSYTSIALEPHTDGTFFSTAPGIQIFHCHEASNCGGGETLLLDGFALAKVFKENHPEGYDFFSKYPIESEYIHVQSEPKAHYFSKDLVFKHCPISGKLNQVRINAYDRAPHEKMTLEAQEKFYEYFPKLIEMSKSPEFKVTFQLNAGETLLVNNYRLLHGRTAFNGKRLLTGCYLSMDCFKSRYNSLKNCFH